MSDHGFPDNPNHMRRLERAFELTASVPRQQRAEHACACFHEDDPQSRALREMLLAMLEADAAPPVYLAEPAIGAPVGPGAAEGAPRAAGFQIREVLGRGGMSVVYLAHQLTPPREVALKVLRPVARALGGDARLRREAEALARLSHPGIAQVYHLGVLEPPDDRAFIAMELIDGQPITEQARHRPLRERVSMLASVAEAVGHAHVRGVIHRDLKPANVLVDRNGVPKVLDFGVARLLQDGAEGTNLTGDGLMLGTVGWMAPEQLEGPGAPIDQRVDVYALGVLAYEVLAGRPAVSLAGLDLAAQLRWVERTEPRPLGAVSPELRGDLGSIVRMAMERDPDRRYTSAGELAADLRRYLADQPVTARPPTTRYLLGKLVRRHRVPAAAAGLVLLTLVTAVGVSASYASREARAAEDARLAAAEAGRSASAAKAARAAESERAEELDAVSTFHEQQLGTLDIADMARTIRRAVASEIDGLEVDSGGRAMALLDSADLTTITRDAVLRHIFEPSLAAIEREFADQPVLQGRLFVRVGSTMDTIGLLDEATGPIEAGTALLEAHLGSEHARTMGAQLVHARSLLHRGRMAEAESVAWRAVTILARDASDREQLMTALSVLGSARLQAGDLAGAQAPLREGLELARASADPQRDPEPIASALGNYGSLLLRQGRLEEAEACYREALELRRRGSTGPTTELLASLNMLSVVLQRQGQIEEAEALAREAYAQGRLLHGEDHPDTLRYMNNLAYLLKHSDRLDEAGQLYQNAIHGYRALMGPDHDLTLRTMANLAALRRAQGNLDEADSLYRSAIASYLKTGQSETWQLANTRLAYSMTLEKLGREEEALEALRMALPILEDQLGGMNPATMTARHRLASTLRRRGSDGDLDEAEGLLRAALEGGEAGPGPTNTLTLSVRRELASLLMQRGAWQEAKAVADAFEASSGARAARFQSWVHKRWHAAEPDAGHDVIAARYQSMMERPEAAGGVEDGG